MNVQIFWRLLCNLSFILILGYFCHQAASKLCKLIKTLPARHSFFFKKNYDGVNELNTEVHMIFLISEENDDEHNMGAIHIDPPCVLSC